MNLEARQLKEPSAKEGSAAEGSAAEGSAAEASAKEASAKEASAKEASAKEASAKEASAKEASAKEASAKEASAKEAGFAEVALLEELAPEAPLRVVVEGVPILLVRLQGEVFAVASTCTHEREDLDAGFVEEGCIECPRHGARFDLRTGAALTLPATRGLATYQVRIEDGRILVAAQANPSVEGS